MVEEESRPRTAHVPNCTTMPPGPASIVGAIAAADAVTASATSSTEMYAIILDKVRQGIILERDVANHP